MIWPGGLEEKYREGCKGQKTNWNGTEFERKVGTSREQKLLCSGEEERLEELPLPLAHLLAREIGQEACLHHPCPPALHVAAKEQLCVAGGWVQWGLATCPISWAQQHIRAALQPPRSWASLSCCPLSLLPPSATAPPAPRKSWSWSGLSRHSMNCSRRESRSWTTSPAPCAFSTCLDGIYL